MKSFFALTIAALSVSASASICNFKKGETISRTTGLRVYRTIAPKVIEGIGRVDVKVKNMDVRLTSPMSSIEYNGMSSCQDNDLKDGYDCYEAEELGSREVLIRIYVGNRGQKDLILAEELNVPGGAYQQDFYHCL